MILSCVIIDDEPLAVSLLESYVNKTPFLELRATYNSALQAMESLNGQSIDLLFLDIQMPELTGLEFSRMVNEQTRIIFTTAFDHFALESYKVNALDYLLKPISYPEFLQASNKALQWFELSANSKDKDVNETIFLKSEYKLLQIKLQSILYIEGLKDYVKVYIEEEQRPIISHISMKAIEDMLPSDRFIRVHRSFIVQPEKIKVIERNRIIFGKEYIPISESYKDKFYDFLTRHSLFPNS